MEAAVSGARRKKKAVARKSAGKAGSAKGDGRKRRGAAAKKKRGKSRGGGARRRRKSLRELLREANGRAHERADRENRRMWRKETKTVRAVNAAVAADMDGLGGLAVPEEVEVPPQVPWWVGGIRLWLGLLLLPVVALTLWTFVSVFAEATLRGRFWMTLPFWYFAAGVLMMLGWFWSGLLRHGFLYLYVLGHEVTHVLFIWAFGGRVGRMEVTIDGGYVVTDKTNIVIALAPYFMPFWTVVVLGVWGMLQLFLPMSPFAEKVMFGAIGWTWAFHALWTMWMIPRDQPDLQENGTFLSLGIIVLANTLVLATMLCVAWDKLSFLEFGQTWWMHARHWLHLLSVVSRDFLGPPA